MPAERTSPRFRSGTSRPLPSCRRPAAATQITIPSRILDLKWAAGPDGSTNDKAGGSSSCRARRPVVEGTAACRVESGGLGLSPHSPPAGPFPTHNNTERVSGALLLQVIFALTADVDGFDGGPLWRSADGGSSWGDMTAALSGAVPAGEVRFLSSALSCRAGRQR